MPQRNDPMQGNGFVPMPVFLAVSGVLVAVGVFFILSLRSDVNALKAAKVVSLSNTHDEHTFTTLNTWIPIQGLKYKDKFDVDMRVVAEVHYHALTRQPASPVDVGVFKNGQLQNIVGAQAPWPGTGVTFLRDWASYTTLAVFDVPKGVEVEIDVRAQMRGTPGKSDVNAVGLVLDFRPKLS